MDINVHHMREVGQAWEGVADNPPKFDVDKSSIWLVFSRENFAICLKNIDPFQFHIL